MVVLSHGDSKPSFKVNDMSSKYDDASTKQTTERLLRLNVMFGTMKYHVVVLKVLFHREEIGGHDEKEAPIFLGTKKPRQCRGFMLEIT